MYRKIILALVLVLSFTLCLCACSKDKPTDDNTTPTETVAPTSDNTVPAPTTEQQPVMSEPISADKTEPKEVKELLEALRGEDFDTILEMCYLPENSVVCASDIKYWMNRSNFAELLGADIEVLSANKAHGEITSVLKAGTTEQVVRFALNDNDDMALQLTGAYKEAVLRAPGKSAITINGITLDESKWAVKNNDNDIGGDVLYTLICPSKTMTAHVVTEFGEDDLEVQWQEEKNRYSLLTYCDNEVLNNAHNAIRNILNDMLADIYEGDKSLADMEKYFASDANPEKMQEIVDILTKEVNTSFQSDIKISNVKSWEGQGNFYTRNDTIAVNVEMTTSYDLVGTNMTHISQIYFILRLFDDNFVIYTTNLTNLT